MNNLIQKKFNQALSFHQQGQLSEAEKLYLDILRTDSSHADTLHFLGVINYQTGRYQQAIDLINKAISINPRNASFYSNLGVALKEIKEYQAALDSYSKAISINPNNADFYYNHGNALSKLNRFKESIKSYDKAIAISSNNAFYYYNRGNAFLEIKEFVNAATDYNKAITLNPNNADFYYNYGNSLVELEKLQDAITNYNKAIAINSNNSDYYYNCADALRKSKKYEMAIIFYDKAIHIKSNDYRYYCNRGVSFFEIEDIPSAIESYNKAIELNPEYENTYMNLGNVFTKLGKVELALINYNKSLELNPSYADVYFNRGTIQKIDLALADYKKAFELKAEFKFFVGLFHTKIKISDWTNFECEIEEIKNKVEANEQAVQPFSVITAVDSLKINFLAAKNFVNSNYPENSTTIPKRQRSSKIKLAYYSADFHNHATSYLMAEMFELHDRSKFEVIGFSFGPDLDDEMRRRVSKSFDKFIDVRLKSNNEIVNLSREMGIDIAVDLKGFTKDMRLGIFAKRCAPIQVSYIGYPGTMGADYMDYIIADKMLIPDEYHKKYYSEKIVYMPNSYQVNDSKRIISDRVWTKEECGLPEDAFVFCCFNNNYKITPKMFDVWMNILKKVSGSVLWLLEDNTIAANNLRMEAVKRGIDSSRLVFAKRAPLAEHLSRHKLADLFLDTVPCNAHTTCSDSLWAGLPVLTLAGESFAARVSASLLSAINLSDMITNDVEEYESKAIEFALNKNKLEDIKNKLNQNRLVAPLFNTQLFTSNLEKAYEAMYNRYQDDLMPKDIEINSKKGARHLFSEK